MYAQATPGGGATPKQSPSQTPKQSPHQTPSSTRPSSPKLQARTREEGNAMMMSGDRRPPQEPLSVSFLSSFRLAPDDRSVLLDISPHWEPRSVSSSMKLRDHPGDEGSDMGHLFPSGDPFWYRAPPEAPSDSHCVALTSCVGYVWVGVYK